MVRKSVNSYRQRITILQRTDSPDGSGGYNDSYEQIGTYWAEVISLSPKQVFEYASIGVDATHQIKMHGGVTVNENNRILFKDISLEIMHVSDFDNRGVETKILCKEKR